MFGHVDVGWSLGIGVGRGLHCCWVDGATGLSAPELTFVLHIRFQLHLLEYFECNIQ